MALADFMRYVQSDDLQYKVGENFDYNINAINYEQKYNSLWYQNLRLLLQPTED